MSAPVVKVSEGKLRGKICKTYNGVLFYTFKGIPYAKPPTGDLRFSIPEPPEPWDSIRDATKECNICPQYDKMSATFVGNEDCLYLNVYTPHLLNDDLKLPVMVYFHGGGFLFGHGTDDSVHGADFLIEKEVIIVSLNYRLGILGFLSLDRKEAPGNMGLRDQLLALKWVQKNIAQFGGDPKNVTIFGVSAGGASVEYLLLSPLTKGLFHKAIAQSGSSLLHWAQNKKVKELALTIPVLKNQVVKDDDQLLKYLKDMPIKELIEASMLALGADNRRGGIHFGFVPTIEQSGDWEQFISKSTYEMLSKGDFAKVPFMSGFCTREGLLMLPICPAKVDNLATEKSFVSHLPFDCSDMDKNELETKLKATYLDGEKTKDDNASVIDFFSDVDFFGGVYVATSLIAKNNSSVYFYEFSYDGNLNYIKKKMDIKCEGACHGDEGGYLIKSDILNEDNLSDTDKMVRDRMVALWTNFAKYGDPTPRTDNVITTKWEPVAGAPMKYLFIDEKLTMKREPYPTRTKLYEELYKKYNN